MKRLFEITNLLLVAAIFGEGYKKEDEMSECFYKLVCELNKFEEFFDIREVAGPELTLKAATWFCEISGIENPAITRAFWFQFVDIICEMSDEEKERVFKEYFTLSGEYMMEECRNPTSELCLKADLAAGAFVNLISKYKANGVCRTFGENPVEMVP
ncbi:unnamed protein product [Larinioides sclopetarius]|uniref:Uncharacterized protein n=1 Tax=Larinioides sclopetarius TaxID=280406 RepID=A0AAV2BFE7_9ARAC